MKTRGIAILLVVLSLSLLLAGCGSKTTSERLVSKPTQEPQAQQAPEVPAEVPESKPAEAREDLSSDETVANKVLGEETTLMDAGKDVTDKAVVTGEEYNLPVDVTQDSEVFTQVSCADGKISIAIKNTGSDTWVLQRVPGGERTNVGFMNRGIADPTPGCEKDSIEPDESTVCSTIDMGIITGENRVAINTKDDSHVRVVIC